MSKLKVAAFSVSLDGFGAGPNQDRENPLGIRGDELHEWMYPTKMFQKGGTEGTDNHFVEKSMENMSSKLSKKDCKRRETYELLCV